ncbi:hypothetical protein [Pedobacter sp. SYSU D00535]|uniref:hypothetical protein n=1 Tax=Pedobacter sp. SYSU D00535 TaxID=2810308 RepID=UPI001A9613D5|nr:hypothetical protein [Pedobacter sp. SYSU D00535]
MSENKIQMLTKRILLIALASATIVSCKKNQPKPENEQQVQVLGYTQTNQATYDNHFVWSKNEVKSYPKLNLSNDLILFGHAEGSDIYLAQNGSYWKNNSKTDLFQTGGITTSVAYKYYNNTVGALVRKPAQDPAGIFDYSIMEGNTTVFTVAGNAQNRYEFKDFLKLGNTYYLLGYLNSPNQQSIIYSRTGSSVTVIVLNTSPNENFQPIKFSASNSMFYILGYINRNGTLHAAVLKLDQDGGNKSITELNVPTNVVLYDLLAEGTNVHVTGWEPKDNSGSYYAFYVKNNQKVSLSTKQSRAMQLLKYKDDIYIAGLEFEPNQTYKLWKNGVEYGVLKTADNKPIVPLQLFLK